MNHNEIELQEKLQKLIEERYESPSPFGITGKTCVTVQYIMQILKEFILSSGSNP